MGTTLHLTPRLQAVADWVTLGTTLCDVGTDHAHLPAYLLLRGQIPWAIAADIRPGPLARAEQTRRQYHLEERLSLRLCPGLEGIAAHEVETVCICGMGGEMMCGILDQAPWTRADTTLLLQPMRSQPELRVWLQANGYRIAAEQIVREGPRWYTILKVTGGQMAPLSPAEQLAGRPADWVPGPDWGDYLEHLLEKVEKQRRGVAQSSKAEDVGRREILAQTASELLAWRQTWRDKGGTR